MKSKIDASETNTTMGTRKSLKFPKLVVYPSIKKANKGFEIILNK